MRIIYLIPITLTTRKLGQVVVTDTTTASFIDGKRNNCHNIFLCSWAYNRLASATLKEQLPITVDINHPSVLLLFFHHTIKLLNDRAVTQFNVVTETIIIATNASNSAANNHIFPKPLTFGVNGCATVPTYSCLMK